MLNPIPPKASKRVMWSLFCPRPYRRAESRWLRDSMFEVLEAGGIEPSGISRSIPFFVLNDPSPTAPLCSKSPLGFASQ